MGKQSAGSGLGNTYLRLGFDRGENPSALRHLLQKRRGPCGEVVAGAHPGVHAVECGEPHGDRGNKRADLRHQNEQRGLPDKHGFAAHVRAGDAERLFLVFA